MTVYPGGPREPRGVLRSLVRLLAVLTALGLLAGLTLHLWGPNGPQSALNDKAVQRETVETAERRMTKALAARIVAERSAKEIRPGRRAIPLPIRPQPLHATRQPTPTVAPPGFSLVDADHDEMAKGQMSASERAFRPTTKLNVNEWLRSPISAADVIESAVRAGRDWSFGWIEHHPDTALDNIRRALANHGVSVLGTAGNLVRAKLPADAAKLSAILDTPGVVGLGAVPKARKLDWSLAEDARAAPYSEQVPVFITLMEDDPNGVWRAELEEIGATVADFDADIRAYTAVVPYGIIHDLAAADFVLAVEPVGIFEAAHDSAVPAMGADVLRTYRRSTGLFSGVGGGSVPIAVMDTGLNVNHLDIASGRSSICGANFVYLDPRSEELDLWVDEGGHGTHVTGTIVGNGHVEPELAGMAPLVNHIRFAKVLHSDGFGSGDGIRRGMDYLAEASSCPEAGWSDDAVTPLIVNMSLSATSRSFESRDPSARKLDATVWRHRQLYVVANSNRDIHGFSNYGAAKNSLAVGAAEDSGELAVFSSHGPTADGRLAPLVVGAGVSLTSAKGGGSRGDYATCSGTSMASPAVAGVAALLMDAAPVYRERPALARARLMASAVKPDAWFADPSAFPPNNSAGPGSVQARYGMGKVSARTSVLNRNRRDGWSNGAAFTSVVSLIKR